MLSLARALAGSSNIEYVQEDVMDYVEGLLRRQLHFDLIILPVPPVGHGPKGECWDSEVDMAKLVRYLPRLITDDCLGVWLSTDSGATTWKAEGLGQALIEARRSAIHSFCITIDTEARDYLPHMYGAANYTVIDEVRKLPLKVSDIYRRLTT